MFKRVVLVVQVVALVAAAGFVIALFTGGSGTSTASSDGESRSGAEIYAASCAVCHGADGGGGVGPELGGGAVVEAFPDAADQIAIVTDGRGSMPAFGSRFSTEEIAAVVEYTRTGLG